VAGTIASNLDKIGAESEVEVKQVDSTDGEESQ